MYMYMYMYYIHNNSYFVRAALVCEGAPFICNIPYPRMEIFHLEIE